MSTQIAEYSRTEAKLAELRQQYAATIWVIESPAQMDGARKARAEIRKWRVDLEAERKTLKAPALARCRDIDAEAARITAELLALETPVDEAIKRVEAQKEAERQAKIAAEAARVEKARAEIDAIREPARRLIGAPSCDIASAWTKLNDSDVSRADEFGDAAKAAKTETLDALHCLAGKALAHEAEQQRLADERAELVRLRAEQEARQKVEREKIETEERAARERIAEENRKAAQIRAEQERQAREAREREDEDARKLRLAEQTRLDVQRQKFEAERKEADAEMRRVQEIAIEKQRVAQRAANAVVEAAEMLTTFRERFGTIAEFANVVAAIDQYFAVER
jgi:colicin import membrane protein